MHWSHVLWGRLELFEEHKQRSKGGHGYDRTGLCFDRNGTRNQSHLIDDALDRVRVAVQHPLSSISCKPLVATESLTHPLSPADSSASSNGVYGIGIS
jgi:hypothetical protein